LHTNGRIESNRAIRWRRTMVEQPKVALVTGSALNIGRAIALAFARDGMGVMVTARSSRADCETTASQVNDAGGESAVHMADISDAVQARGLVEATVARFGRLDVLVNNASVRRQTSFAEMTPEEWREILGSTLDGAFYCAHAAAPHIAAAGGGNVINIGGISAHIGAVGRVHAVTAKAGMVGLTRALAKELAPSHITVNIVVPGSINTIRGAAAGGNSGRAHLPDNLAGRMGNPEEIAGMVHYLTTTPARFITGQTIHVNGGAFMP
jgi:3-oxoacyl-[acyl-carrier protein] reductase